MPRILSAAQMLAYSSQDRCPECKSEDYACTDPEPMPSNRRRALFECTDCGARWVEEYRLITVAVVKDGTEPDEEDTQSLNLEDIQQAIDDAEEEEEEEEEDQGIIVSVTELVEGMEGLGYRKVEIINASRETMKFLVKYEVPPEAVSILRTGKFVLFPNKLPDSHPFSDCPPDMGQEPRPQEESEAVTPSQLQRMKAEEEQQPFGAPVETPFVAEPVDDAWPWFPWDMGS